MRGEADRNVSQDSGEDHGGAQAPRPELDQLCERMTAIKEEVIAEVDRKWGSPF